MSPALAALAVFPGLALGGFLNVVAARVPLKRSLVRPGSACMSCKAPIVWYDNIPLISYFALRGRCAVQLALLMGAMLGKVVSVALIIGMLSAVIPGMYLLARHGRAARKMGIPFAPFLALGSVIALFAGEWLLDAYLGVLRS